MKTVSDPEAEPPPSRDVTSITADELRRVAIEAPIVGSKSFDCWKLAELYQRAAQAAEQAGRTDEALVYALLQCLCQIHFSPADRSEPFGPLLVRADGQRTIIPSDIPPPLNDALATIVPNITNPVLRARIADIVWTNDRKQGDLAQIAISAYCQSVELLRCGALAGTDETADCTDFDVIAFLRRAAQLAVMTKGKQPFPTQLRDEIHTARRDAFSRQYAHGFLESATLDLDYEISSPAEIATEAETLVNGMPALGDGYTALALLELAERAFRDAKDVENENRVVIRAAECCVSVADALAQNPMLQAHRLAQAIAIYGRARGQKNRRNELRKRLIDVQARALDDLKPIGVPGIDLTEIAESARAKLSGRRFGDALRMLILACRSPSPASLREQALKNAKQAPLSSMVTTEILDRGGKVTFRSPGMSGAEADQEQALRYQIIQLEDIRRGIAFQGKIDVARALMHAEHGVTAEKLLAIMQASPFVPPGHEFIFAQGFARWFGGDYISATSILVPQLENSLRYLLTNAGEDVSTLKNDGTQEDRSITSLFEAMRPALIRVLGEEIVFELENLFLIRGGPALRHVVAHGQLPTGGFYGADAGYASWFILHLCCIPLLPYWNQIEPSEGSAQ